MQVQAVVDAKYHFVDRQHNADWLMTLSLCLQKVNAAFHRAPALHNLNSVFRLETFFSTFPCQENADLRSVQWKGPDSTSAECSTPPRKSVPRLRIGYLSYDLNDHPTAHLCIGLCAYHNYEKVTSSAFRCASPRS